MRELEIAKLEMAADSTDATRPLIREVRTRTHAAALRPGEPRSRPRFTSACPFDQPLAVW